ncbi:MAG: Maf family protein [Oscillospiraceae bacterium]|nr:Maf family protein [Oscillospiraceae bacterium]
MELILGSQSPRRRELLERMGLKFRVLTADIDETKYETEDPEASVRRICQAKAAAVAQAASGGEPQAETLILAADTIVVLDGRILGKPHDAAEAKAMLRALSGREHAVYTAFTLLPVAGTANETAGDGGRGSFGSGFASAQDDQRGACTHCEKTLVKFRELTEAEIDAYTASGEPMDKAGAYGIQGLGAMLVAGIRGDFFTVMGLPVCALTLALKRYGLDPLSP